MLRYKHKFQNLYNACKDYDCIVHYNQLVFTLSFSGISPYISSDAPMINPGLILLRINIVNIAFCCHYVNHFVQEDGIEPPFITRTVNLTPTQLKVWRDHRGLHKIISLRKESWLYH